MKTIYLFSAFLLGCFNLYAQPQAALPYQGVLRNSDGSILPNQQINLRFSILDSVSTGPVVFSETQHTITSSLGLFSVNIGLGSVIVSSFGSINWNNNAKFLQVEIDTSNGSSFILMGTTQLFLNSINSNSSGGANNSPHYIGERYGGGIVFFVYDNGQHGLIASTSDILYSCLSCPYAISDLGRSAKNVADGVGAGFKNTLTSIATQSANTNLQSFNMFYFANIYSVTENGVTYGDWYVPSKSEVKLMYQQKNILGMAAAYYWSSNANTSGFSYAINFSDGNEYAIAPGTMIYTNGVRAVRFF